MVVKRDSSPGKKQPANGYESFKLPISVYYQNGKFTIENSNGTTIKISFVHDRIRVYKEGTSSSMLPTDSITMKGSIR
ncbi:MAG TPA: hypothetical protein VK664_07180 [Flavitalea sp.]|nr:hypothetical protein [Flavitalea sp.]